MKLYSKGIRRETSAMRVSISTSTRMDIAMVMEYWLFLPIETRLRLSVGLVDQVLSDTQVGPWF